LRVASAAVAVAGLWACGAGADSEPSSGTVAEHAAALELECTPSCNYCGRPDGCGGICGCPDQYSCDEFSTCSRDGYGCDVFGQVKALDVNGQLRPVEGAFVEAWHDPGYVRRVTNSDGYFLIPMGPPLPALGCYSSGVLYITANGFGSQIFDVTPETQVSLTLAGTFPEPVSCTLMTRDGELSCDRESSSVVVESAGRGRVLLRVDLAQHRRARFVVTYGAQATGWTVDIGDSIGNDGWGADDGQQAMDAELQVVGTTLSLYGNDLMPGGRLLLEEPNVVAPYSQTELVISDREATWSRAPNWGGGPSPYLFALSRQYDWEGPANFEIFAAFNRVISGRTDRTGRGVEMVEIYLEH
jgi:hypothetical protein